MEREWIFFFYYPRDNADIVSRGHRRLVAVSLKGVTNTPHVYRCETHRKGNGRPT